MNRQAHTAGGSTRRTGWVGLATAFAFLAMSNLAPAQGTPHGVATAEYDFQASGFVKPAGMVSPEAYYGGIAPVGFMSGSACDGGCGPAGCGNGGCGLGGCGLGGCGNGLGGHGGCGLAGCGSCNGIGHGGLLGSLRGKLCGECNPIGGFKDFCYLLSLPLAPLSLRPYSEAGCCSQRWYDLSAEALFLGHNASPVGGNSAGVVTTRGVDGVPVLSIGDVDAGDDLEAGVRLSAAMIFGPGGNLEVIYMGGHEWDDSAIVASPPVFDNAVPPNVISGADLYSFVSDFGTGVAFDDTDRSVRQRLESSSTFHSGEFNYRRRTVGPNCMLQGSWLVGLRYLRYDDNLLYEAEGLANNAASADELRFFSSNDQLDNSLFGAQLGGDLWWSVIPGIQAGVGFKGAWLQNEIERDMQLFGNSLDPGATPGLVRFQDTEREGTVMGEFEAAILYRLTHSWSVRTAYYAIAIEDIAVGTLNADNIRGLVQNPASTEPHLVYDDLVLQGVSVGAEYTW